MARGNQVTLIGNLTNDPKPHTFDSGTKKATFGLAWNEDRKKDDGSWESIGHFFEVEVWGGTVQTAMKFSKGNFVAVTGRLAWRKWEKDGVGFEKVYVVADGVFGEKMYEKGDGSQSGGEQPNQERSRSRSAGSDSDSQPRTRTRQAEPAAKVNAPGDPSEVDEDTPW
jgi:single stranded DNA-binding protein